MTDNVSEALQNLVAAIAMRERTIARDQLLASLDAIEPPGKRPTARPTNGRGKGEKRDPRVLARTVTALHQAIQAAPGSGIEYLGKQMGTPTKDLALPVKKLLAPKRFRTVGHKRATRYFPKG